MDPLALAAIQRAKEKSPKFVNPVNPNPVPEYGRRYIRPHVKATGRERRAIK